MNAAQLHLMFNHIPVMGTLFALLLLAWAVLRKSDELQRTALGAIVFVAILTTPAYLTGEPAELVVEKNPAVVRGFARAHEDAADRAFTGIFLLAVASLAALLVYRKKKIPAWFLFVMLLLMAAESGMFGWAAHLGGKISHPETRGESLPPPETPPSP